MAPNMLGRQRALRII